MTTPPLLVAPREPLRSGLPVRVLRRMVCTACKSKVQPVAVSGTLTTVGCPTCSRQWLVNPEGQAVRC